MTRFSPSRHLIISYYEELKAVADENMNIVRAVAMHFRYPLDKNRSHEFVRRVIKEHEKSKHSDASLK